VSTKAWIIETPVSITLMIEKQTLAHRLFNINGTKPLPIISIIRCPAIKLAINRNISVNGRITNLINSINTKATIRELGLDFGTIWIIVFLVLNMAILIKIEINITIEIDKVNCGKTLKVNT